MGLTDLLESVPATPRRWPHRQALISPLYQQGDGIKVPFVRLAGRGGGAGGGMVYL